MRGRAGGARQLFGLCAAALGVGAWLAPPQVRPTLLVLGAIAASAGGRIGGAAAAVVATAAPVGVPVKAAAIAVALVSGELDHRHRRDRRTLRARTFTDRLTGLRNYDYFSEVLRSELARVRRYGGCMTLVCHSIGTPYEIDTDGCILMIEDLNEEPYMVDAGLHHLIRAGKFDNVKGFVFGTDVNLKENTIPEYVGSSLSIEEILDELIAPLGIPAIANVPVGHGKHMATIPLGARARIDADAKTLDIVEPAVA